MKRKITLLLTVTTFITAALCSCGKKEKDDKENVTVSTTLDATTEADIVEKQEETTTATTETVTQQTEETKEEVTTQAVTETTTEVVISETGYTVQNILGTYVCDRATIMIASSGGDAVNVDITWGSSAFLSAEWTITGTFNPSDTSITYTNGILKYVEYAEDGSSQEEIVYTDGSGSFVFDMSSNSLRWNDAKENAAEGMVFELVNINGTIGR
ncbi:MAG: hypothetical protein J6P57_09495 [Lachnospiraceae bacterium]|nr:hypothetical protein [Lachnospiraceae bacterium]